MRDSGAMGRRASRSRRALVVFLATLLSAPLMLLATPSVAHAAVGGLDESSTTTYTVDIAARLVRVRIDISATNTIPDRHTSRGVEQSYFNGVGFVTVAEATNFRAVNDAGSTMAVTTRPASTPIAQEVVVHIPNLFYNHTQHVHLDFDLPSGAPRSKSFTRVTSAYATFSAWAGSSQAGQANVVIVVPKSFTVELVGDTMTKRATGATVTYTANEIGHPDGFFVTVSARNDDQLVSNDISVSNHPVDIRAFPDDPGWGSFVEKRVRTGLPALETLIGLPWPAGNRLLITETVTPYLYGYGGWYSASDNTIEIGDELDPHVVLHEISHAWFNDHLFNERWIDEGLAQEYAARAVAAAGGKLDSPKAVNPAAPGATRLESWTNVDLKADNSQVREDFGYNASWYVIRQLTKDVGVTGMRRVFLAASKSALPYIGDPTVPAENPEAAGGAGSWKRFLDYLDQSGGSRHAGAIFAKYVALPDDPSFAKRAAARTAYRALLSKSTGWAAPLAVRESMTDWSFPTATTQMAAATKVIETKDAIAKIVGPLSMQPSEKLRRDYEYKVDDLAQVQREADAELNAATALRDANRTVDAHHGFFAKIGLLGANDKSDLADARTSFTKGDAAGSRASALAAMRVVHGANSAGMLRAGLALGALVVLVLLVLGIRRRRRRRLARRDDATTDPFDPGPGNEEVAPGFAG